MRKSTLSTLALALAAILSLLMGAAFAKSIPDPKNKVYEYKHELEGAIAGKVLKPGTYNIKVTYENAEKGTVAIYKNRELIVELPCRIEKSDLKLDANSVAYGRNAQGERFVRWLFLSGRQEKIIITSE